MVESRYWKEELARIARTLKPVPKPPRWSERAHCIVERDLCVGFFIVRRMIELYKVSSRTRDYQMEVCRYVCMRDVVTPFSHPYSEGIYDFENERLMTKTPLYVSNQFIHSCMSMVLRDETRNWSDVLIVSDRDRDKLIWRVPLAQVRRLFSLAAEDYPSMVSWSRETNGNQYSITTD